MHVQYIDPDFYELSMLRTPITKGILELHSELTKFEFGDDVLQLLLF